MQALCVPQLACVSENNLSAYRPHDKQLRDARCTADWCTHRRGAPLQLPFQI